MKYLMVNLSAIKIQPHYSRPWSNRDEYEPSLSHVFLSQSKNTSIFDFNSITPKLDLNNIHDDPQLGSNSPLLPFLRIE